MLRATAFQWILVVVLVIFGCLVLQPSTPTASAYPTALDNYDVQTARSYDCQWSWRCVNGGESDYCVPSPDPLEGCQYLDPQYSRCMGCYI